MKNLSIFAEALVDNREYKNARVDGSAIGVANARKWSAAVKACRIPAYSVRVYRYNHMGETESISACDQTALYNALAVVIDMVGDVNGAKLNAHNVAEEIISSALHFRVIDKTVEMAHARNEYRKARKAMVENETEATIAAYEARKAEVKALEEQPGNCQRIAEIVSENAFVKAVEILLGDAIKKQALKSAEEVKAEEDARKAEKKARKQAKRQAAAEAKKNESAAA